MAVTAPAPPRSRPSIRHCAPSSSSESIRFLTRELPTRFDAAREIVGSFLRADPDGLAFVPNATTAISTVLASLTFEPGDELLTDDHEYNAVINAMQRAAERTGARVVVAPIPFPIAGPDDIVEAFWRPSRHRLACSWSAT